MPQLAVNMKERALINIGSKLKVNGSIMRHAPYSNRCGALKTNEKKHSKDYNLLPLQTI